MNLCNKISQFFSMGYIFKCSKNAFYGLTIHPFDRISKKIFGEMVSKWPVMAINFAEKLPFAE